MTVILPDDKHSEVSYYCSDALINDADKALFTKLYIQLHDCVCTIQIEKSLCKRSIELETLIHNKVIATKGHLCE